MLELKLRTSGADNNLKTLIIVQIFNKEDFFLILPWMYSLYIVVYETSTFFHITGSDDDIFINNRIVVNPEPVIVWRWMATHFK